MSTTWYYTLASVIVVSAISLIGLAVVAVQPQRLRRALFVLVSLVASSTTAQFVAVMLPRGACFFSPNAAR